MTLSEIVDDLRAQLDWRGPGDKPQGHIVMPRSETDELLTYIIQMREALAKLSDPLLISSEHPEIGMARALKLITTMQAIAKAAAQ